jgi:hypothetical protein
MPGGSRHGAVSTARGRRVVWRPHQVPASAVCRAVRAAVVVPAVFAVGEQLPHQRQRGAVRLDRFRARSLAARAMAWSARTWPDESRSDGRGSPEDHDGVGIRPARNTGSRPVVLRAVQHWTI